MSEKFRYESSGQWYKGNTHIHTTASDGGKTAGELAQMYAEAGYDFLFRTDHHVASDVGAEVDEPPLLWLAGVELNGPDGGGSSYHIVCLGSFQGISGDNTLEENLKIARDQGGILILAHPNWMGNSQEDGLRHGFHGVEIYNHVCRWLNGKGSGLYLWDSLLIHQNILGFSVDDAHVKPAHPGWDGGWIKVSAPQCSREAITNAIKDGNFYSTCGPEFHTITHSNGSVGIRTSPVRFARLVGPNSKGARTGSFDGELLTEAEFELPSDWSYVRLEIEDARGHRAWTNTLFK